MIIPYSRQSIDDHDVAAVAEVLRSPFLTTGPAGPRFEEAMAQYVHATYAVAVSSGTAALHVAMLACGVGPGDPVYVSAISFAASANCARYCGATVRFIDVDPDSGNLSVPALARMLADDEARGLTPKAVVAVHLGGRPCDLAALQALRTRYGFALIEDAAHALGAVYAGEPVGCGRYADITAFSFHPVKIITTGEGGMCVTNRPDLAERLRLAATHGIVRDPGRFTRRDLPAYYYEQQSLGYNYRLSDLQAALGLSQLQRVDEFLRLRREQAATYRETLADCPDLLLPAADTPDNLSAWHLYQVRIEGGRRDAIFNALRAKGIGVQVHYLPIYRHPYYQSLKAYPPLPGAERFFARTLSLPLYPGLLLREQQLAAVELMSLLER